jgi:probable HAF family extracellular repeat protein
VICGCLVMLAACGSDHSPTNDAGPATSWLVADLGPGRCVAVNARVQVLGNDTSGASFLIDSTLTRTALGGLDGAAATGVALAPSGDVVGYVLTTSSKLAVEYTGGAWTQLAGVTGDWSAAIGIDEHGQVAGVAGVGAPGEMHAFVVSHGAEVPLPLPAQSSAAYLVAGAKVAGVYATSMGQTHGFVATGSQLTDLGTLGGSASAPYGMNARGDVAGASETTAGTLHAFVAPGGGALVDLGVPTGALTSEARGVSDSGQVAGNAYDSNGASRPVVFVPGHEPIELLPSDASNPYASATVVGVAPNGLIAGWGMPRDPSVGPSRCLLWTPGGHS